MIIVSRNTLVITQAKLLIDPRSCYRFPSPPFQNNILMLKLIAPSTNKALQHDFDA